MANGNTPITIVGNLVTDPELRFTPSGAPVCNFRVVSTPRTYNKQTSQWEDGEGMFLTCNVWRQAAENAAQSLRKGMRVIVHGNIKSRSYQTREGENRTVFEVDVEEVGPSLLFATAQVDRSSKNNGGGAGNNPQQNQGGFGGFAGGNQPAQQHQGATWGQPAQDGGEPPF